MKDYKIVVRKDGWVGGCVLLYESDKEEAEKEAQKFREGRYLEDLIYQGFKVYVEEVVD
jgi:hypothetical protein